MKKYLKIILIVIALLLIGGWIFWQQYKKSIIKNSIENAVNKGSGNLYYIQYDSSFIDEVNGNASFYNVALQSDSLQKQLKMYDTASEPTVFNVMIEEVSIKGADIQGLLNNTSVQAKSIYIKRPVIFIIASGKKEKKLLTGTDSLAIYEKLLGKFNNIKADEIIIENGSLFFSDKTGSPHTTFKDIGINLKNFKIDSTKDYDNIASYFIKGIVAKVKEVHIKGDKNLATFTDVEYNAPGRFIHLKKFQQVNDKAEVVFDVNNTTISNISTDAFILNQQLRAEALTSDGGLLTFYRKKRDKADSTNDDVQIDNNYFNEAVLNKVSIKNTRIMIYNMDEPTKAPFILTNVKFNATDIQKVDSNTNVKNLISKSSWTLSADGFSFITENKRYKMSAGPFDINNGNSSMRVKYFTMTPTMSEAAFSKSLRHQEDLYNLQLNNIVLTGIDTKLLLTQNKIMANTATLQPIFKVYRDRLVAPDLSSKVGKYPHQLLEKINLPFSVKQLFIQDGLVSYRERSDLSKKTGTVFFKNIRGTISNVTNMKEVISKNNLLTLDATASFMGLTSMHSVWKLPLNNANGDFEVSGEAGSFKGPALNPMIEPLGMASIKSGQVNKLSFNMKGNNYNTTGSTVFLYNDLKVELFKNDSAGIKKKGLMSILSNALIKDANPQKDVIRTGEINWQRDVTKSFFNLVWKGVFSGIKKTVQKL